MSDKQPKDFDRLYGSAKESPLVCQMEAFADERDIELSREFFEQFDRFKEAADQAEQEFNATFGPRIGFTAPSSAVPALGMLLTVHIDVDLHESSGDITIDLDDWHQTALHRAARAYQRECGWDFTPSQSGVWVLCIMPTRGTGSTEQMWFSGILVGFAIIEDREDDGQCDSLAHIWTASSVRRKGIGRQLINYAKTHFPMKHVEGPVTELGHYLFERAWPECLQDEE